MSANTPQSDDPREAFPRLLTTFEHLTAWLDMLLPLTCMTPSRSRDRLPVQYGYFRALNDLHAECQPQMLPNGNTSIAPSAHTASYYQYL
jgi:hypothetical protein